MVAIKTISFATLFLALITICSKIDIFWLISFKIGIKDNPNCIFSNALLISVLKVKK